MLTERHSVIHELALETDFEVVTTFVTLLRAKHPTLAFRRAWYKITW